MAGPALASLDPEQLAAALASSSTSSIADLLCADLALRQRAAQHLAHQIVHRLAQPDARDDRQIAMPL